MSSVSGAEVVDDDGVGVIGDVLEKACFEMNSTRWGGVENESTRTAV